MPAYHSQFNELTDCRMIGNMAMLPIRTKVRGPAPSGAPEEDIIDEAIQLYRANCFFRNYELQGPSDRLLIYVILFIGECLSKIGSMAKGDNYPSMSESLKALNVLALANFALPGDSSFPLNAMYEKPSERAEVDLMKNYLSQIRQEVAIRLPERLYAATYADTDGGKRPTKWWMCFQKRKFMNKSL